jgi:kynurenine formamidase
MRVRAAVGLILFALAAAFVGCAQRAEPASAPRVVDLGHALAESDPTWSGERVFTHKTVATMAKDGYFAAEFATEEHFGTHLDAPAHFAPGGLTVDRIPADRLVRPAVCINVTAAVQASEDYRVTLADLQAFERDHGAIAEGADVLIATGWDARWPDAGRYMNVRNGVKHFPGLSVEAARFLAADRKIAGLIIDTPSVDYGPSEKFEVHQVTMSAGLYHVENAAGLTSLPSTGFTVVVAPIKIQDGSGGPARVFALLR